MRLDWSNLAAIIGMALATYACRGGGYWVFRQVRPTPLVRAVLAFIPGTLFVSYVTPALVAGGPGQLVGAAVTLVIMATTGSLIGAIVGGTGTVWLIYAFR